MEIKSVTHPFEYCIMQALLKLVNTNHIDDKVIPKLDKLVFESFTVIVLARRVNGSIQE